MATIETRKRRNGLVGYTIRIRLKRDGVIVHEWLQIDSDDKARWPS